jgi:rubrerythrin
MQKFKCSICGYIHDEFTGAKWTDLPDNFVCPKCGALKSLFKLFEETASSAAEQTQNVDSAHVDKIKELSSQEISAICSSLAKGCEKQRLIPEMEAFNKIASYFKSKTSAEKSKTDTVYLHDAAQMLDADLADGFLSANNAAKENADRGALRSLVWSEKTSAMMKSLLDRFAKEGDAMLENTKIFVCDICGFIYLGDTLPQICPVCKVPNHKIIQIERS